MSIVRENDCVGCPQGCVHCGRGTYYLVECDACGEKGDRREMFFEYKKYHFCKDCFPEFLKEEGILEEVPGGVCTYCAEEEETMYKIGEEIVCENCLSDYLEENYAYYAAGDILGRD